MNRQRSIALAGLLALCTGAGLAVAELTMPPEDPEVVDVLSGVSFSPNKTDIDLIMGSVAVEELVRIAQNSGAESDPGLRIRAFRALGHYETSDQNEIARSALSAGVSQFASAESGVELLYLRAAVFSLSEISGEDSVAQLVPLLDHSSRDIRAACAEALAITGAAAAIDPLRDRALVEEETQVQLAISEALFKLENGR